MDFKKLVPFMAGEMVYSVIDVNTRMIKKLKIYKVHAKTSIVPL